MSTKVSVSGLSVDASLAEFINQQALPGTGVSETQFWEGLAGIVQDLTDKNLELLQTRADIQAKMDDYHRAFPGPIADLY